MNLIKNSLFVTAILFTTLAVKAQQTYISVSNTFYTNTGTLAQKSSPAIEVGRQYGPISVGIDVGKVNCSRTADKDTTLYVELRPNLNVFQQGKFTNTLTIGLGIVPFATQSMLGELSYGIEIAASQEYHANINFGQYYFSGTQSSTSLTYFGVSIIRYFPKFKKK
jgi:hypothetical protein